MATKSTKALPITQNGPLPAPDFEQALDQRRIKDVAAARVIFDRMMVDNALRFRTINQTRNQLEGGRPWSPQQLEDQGASWQTNVNFGDAEAARDRTLLPFWNAVHGAPHAIAVKIPLSSPKVPQWQVSFQEAFDEYKEDWGAAYFIEYMNFASNYVNYGPGIIHWADKYTPRWKAVNVQRAIWPKNARMAPDEWEVMGFVQDMSASDLYRKVKTKGDAKTAKYQGWDINAIKAAITYFKDGVYTPDPRDYTRMQDLMVNNDIAVSTPFEPLQIAWLYVKGFDGKIGAYAFTQQGGVEDFLFQDDNYAEKFQQCIAAVWYNTGTDSMIHSIKGFGIKNYFFSNLQNRTKSRFIDSATFSFGMNFQRNEDNTPDEAPPIENYGPVTIFPPGMTPISIAPNMTQSAGVIEMLANNQSENNALYRQEQSQIADSDTATQAKILASMAGSTSQSSAAIYLAQVAENMFAEEVRRLRIKGSPDEDAKAFQARLKADGVPDEVIYDQKIRVKTGANAGNWNPVMREQKWQQGLALSKIPGVNTRYFLTNLIAETYGSDALDSALLPEGAQSNPGQRRQADMENSDFGQGAVLHAIPEDDHFVHLQQHLPPLQQVTQNFAKTKQITPEQTSALVIGLEHSAEHMQFLSQDESMKAEFQMVNGPFRAIQNIAKGILMHAQQNGGQLPGQQPQPGQG